jgi:DNA-binding NtrC family response regulator
MEDLPVLVQYCLKKICFRTGKCVPGISEEGLQILQNYSWPGNIRELNNVIERAVILSTGENITVDDLTADIKSSIPSPAVKSDRQSLAEMEREHILQILHTTEGNKTRAAEILGISKKTLYHKLREYGLME